MPKTSTSGAGITELIQSSGILFHREVVDFLKGRNWDVLISPYYSDAFSNKAREVDVIAEKLFTMKTIRQEELAIRVQLFLECKYVDSPIAFLFEDRNEGEVQKKLEEIFAIGPGKELKMYSHTENHRDFAPSNVAKLYTANQAKKDVIYSALNQVLNGLIYSKPQRFLSPKTYRGRPEVVQVVKCPIIICKDFTKLYRIDNLGGGHSLITDSSFQLEVLYSYTNRKGGDFTEYFLVDVVDFSKFEVFLESLDSGCAQPILNKFAWDKESEDFNT